MFRATKRILLAILYSTLLAAAAGAAEIDPAVAGRLIVFIQNSVSNDQAADRADRVPRADSVFRSRYLPKIEEAARAQGVEVTVLDAAHGAPEEVTLTPLIVFQNYRGRSIYQGRYIYPDKIAHFMRTARYVPLQAEPSLRRELAVHELGRAKVGAPIKITPPAGTLPRRFDEAAFQRRARAAIERGFADFRTRREAAIGRGDRLFYLDFYPYRSADGAFYLSLAVYSQFSCIDPIYVQFDQPLSGKWSDYRKIFTAAGRQLEQVVADAIGNPGRGDDFEALPARTPLSSWEQLGLALPPAPERKTVVDAGRIELAREWVIAEQGAADPPRLLFHFAAPLDSYAGEVRELRGELTLGEQFNVREARGFVEARTGTVTMGEASLDKSIRGGMLRVEQFPLAKFTLESVAPNYDVVQFGVSTQAVCRGAFTLLDKTIPIEVRAELDPLVDDAGEVRLNVRAAFAIRLKETFGIAGPDGPAPQNDTLEFAANFMLEPKKK